METKSRTVLKKCPHDQSEWYHYKRSGGRLEWKCRICKRERENERGRVRKRIYLKAGEWGVPIYHELARNVWYDANGTSKYEADRRVDAEATGTVGRTVTPLP